MKFLFEKERIGSLELKNRFVRSAVWMKGATDDGHLTDSLNKTYGDLAEGGVGLIITGYAYISPTEQPNPNMLGIYEDAFIAEYKPFTRMIHEKGSKVAMQLAFGGSQSHHPEASRMDIIAPSAVKNRVTGLLPREATEADITHVVKGFGDAACRAKAAGFDAVQIHAAHGYFLSAFLTPYYNRRTDAYNGDIHNRARIIYEVYEEVRNRVGKDFPVMIKLNHDDFMDEGEGLTFKDAKEIFKHLDHLGVDAFEVSATNESSGKGLMPARTGLNKKEKESYFREATAEIAEMVTAPVILMGGNRSTDLMEAILNKTGIRLFSLARPLLAEPDLIRKWKMHPGHKPACISCNKCWTTKPNSCILK